MKRLNHQPGHTLRPEEFPLGSEGSRAAARALLLAKQQPRTPPMASLEIDDAERFIELVRIVGPCEVSSEYYIQFVYTGPQKELVQAAIRKVSAESGTGSPHDGTSGARYPGGARMADNLAGCQPALDRKVDPEAGWPVPEPSL